jgi:hypothetical protein
MCCNICTHHARYLFARRVDLRTRLVPLGRQRSHLARALLVRLLQPLHVPPQRCRLALGRGRALRMRVGRRALPFDDRSGRLELPEQCARVRRVCALDRVRVDAVRCVCARECGVAVDNRTRVVPLALCRGFDACAQ